MISNVNPNATKWAVAVSILAILVAAPVRAQNAGAVLSGMITGPTGSAIPNATVSVKNVTTGRPQQTQTNLTGRYTIPDLAAGDDEISVSAPGFITALAKVTLTAGARQIQDLALMTSPANAQAPSLGDLGFPSSATQANPAEQARLNKRSHMLQIHQRLGLITTIPLAATLIASAGAGGRNSSTTGRDVHAALGIVTAGMYFTTASYAIFAPKVPGTTSHGPIRLHKALAWIHGPGMILTPILGAMAYQQRSRGERVHGIASAHGAVAWVTGIAYGLSILSVSVKF
jgi:Carboxypeptidase regulatory-like domain